MNEWICFRCGRLNLSDSNCGGKPALCHNCKTSINYSAEVEELEKEQKNLEDKVDDLENTIGIYNVRITKIDAEIKELLNGLTAKKPPLFERFFILEKEQKPLEVFV